MAARENQGLQIALIVFVMLTIVLIVTTFLFFQNYRDEQTKNKKAADDVATANKDREKAKNESAECKAAMDSNFTGRNAEVERLGAELFRKSIALSLAG